jgi:hypothetical protein
MCVPWTGALQDRNPQMQKGADGKNTGKMEGTGGMSLRVGIGSSSSESTVDTHETTAHGSTIRSNGDVAIIAREGNLTVTGSRVEGENVGLAAKQDILLQSAKETTEQRERSKAPSGEVGITIGSEAGIGVYVSASAASGKGEGNSASHVETVIKGNQSVSFVSGGDTTLEGAQRIGERVVGSVGGDFIVRDYLEANQIDPSSPEGRALLLAASALTGAAVGGGEGAGIALSATNYNYLTHAQLEEHEQRLTGCGDDQACRQKEIDRAENLSAIQDQELWDACTGSSKNPGLCGVHVEGAQQYIADESAGRLGLQGDRDKSNEWLSKFYNTPDGQPYRGNFWGGTGKGLADSGSKVFTGLLGMIGYIGELAFAPGAAANAETGQLEYNPLIKALQAAAMERGGVGRQSDQMTATGSSGSGAAGGVGGVIACGGFGAAGGAGTAGTAGGFGGAAGGAGGRGATGGTGGIGGRGIRSIAVFGTVTCVVATLRSRR